jgi:hypothetical protein
MKPYCGSGGIAPRILNFGIKWNVDKESASRLSRFTSRERAPATYWIGVGGGPVARSGHGGKKEYSQLLPGIEPPILQPVVQRYTIE